MIPERLAANEPQRCTSPCLGQRLTRRPRPQSPDISGHSVHPAGTGAPTAGPTGFLRKCGIRGVRTPDNERVPVAKTDPESAPSSPSPSANVTAAESLARAAGRPLPAVVSTTGVPPDAPPKARPMQGGTARLRGSVLHPESIHVVEIAVKSATGADFYRSPNSYLSKVASSLSPRRSLYPERATSPITTRRLCGKQRHVARSFKSRLAPGAKCKT